MRSRRSFFVTTLALLLSCASALPAAAQQSGGASQFIRKLGDQAIGVMQQSQLPLDARETQFRAILADGFDLNFIGQFALGRSWQSATPEQRTTYQQLFGEYILKVYSSRFGGYSGETLNVVAERQVPGQPYVFVSTRIDRPTGPPIQAEWRVRTADSYKIVDIMVEGISMAATQRSEFDAIVKRDGVDGLIHMLDVRTNKASATAAR
jgi:phospholipid transport system substrate-binding protein